MANFTSGNSIVHEATHILLCTVHTRKKQFIAERLHSVVEHCTTMYILVCLNTISSVFLVCEWAIIYTVCCVHSISSWRFISFSNGTQIQCLIIYSKAVYYFTFPFLGNDEKCACHIWVGILTTKNGGFEFTLMNHHYD